MSGRQVLFPVSVRSQLLKVFEEEGTKEAAKMLLHRFADVVKENSHLLPYLATQVARGFLPTP